jgi:hypothetical protein
VLGTGRRRLLGIENTAWPSKLEGNSGTVTLKGEVGGAPTHITCTKDNFAAQPKEEGESAEDTITLSSCTVSEPSKCIVTESITAVVTGRVEESGGKLIDKLTGNGENKKWVEITYKNKGSENCPLKNKTFALNGTQTCEFDANIRVYEEKHELICKTSGSELTLGARSATYEDTTTIAPEEGETWLAD